jgi:hypothetical protein
MRFEPIQFSEMMAYKQAYDLDMDELDVHILCQLDMKWQIAQPDLSKK